MMAASHYLGLEPGAPMLGTAAFAVAEENFYSGIRTSTGAFKTTARNRLGPMNDLFFDILSKCKEVPSVVMDIGASSGVTTLEWLKEFEKRGITVSMVAADLTISTYLADIGAGWRALLEPTGHILQIEFAGFGLRSWFRRLDYATGTFIPRALLLSIVRRTLSARGVVFPLEAAAVGSHGPQWRITGPFPLITPALRWHERVQILDDNILAPNPPDRIAVADVLRIANLLQKNYFSNEQIRVVVDNLRQRCRGAGSLIAVCRNYPDRIEGSILRLNDNGRFTVTGRLGDGSEVEGFFVA